ncbi:MULTISPECIES: FAD:protein FMN transferase [Sphingobium]|uniref:FAD:protein FMN transferase n=1 Tax=Sphingobium indicum (strain DSM 16413 / CCM 7287 / MTCC 6362 / UT26 / NBRC 101211 / UT26S) TaxID=452662 RepID=D4YZG6_SPHIU|nr:FAD:protein FMN transferase [Sphingobium indicum]BAI95748.1 thiamine biosynthesis lipoprotein [Sphingobium indicum UT26S]
MFGPGVRTGGISDLGGPTMGTSWSARIVDAPPGSAAAIEAVLGRIIAQMSNWEADSAISRFNAAPVGQWMPLPADMLAVLRAGLDMARLSDGAFDPAVGRLVAKWGFGPGGLKGLSEESHHPSPWRAMEIEGDRARRMADVTLDFSGIAKGFAVDAVADALCEHGAAHFLVEIGGELRGQGIRPDLQPWWVDVEAPPGLRLPTLRIALCGMSVATSGDYRRFREEAGIRLSHSMDPATGAPIANDVASVTVLHESAMLADAWATAITIMGHERGMALATRHGIAACLIRRVGGGGQEYMTPALAAMLE